MTRHRRDVRMASSNERRRRTPPGGRPDTGERRPVANGCRDGEIVQRRPSDAGLRPTTAIAVATPPTRPATTDPWSSASALVTLRGHRVLNGPIPADPSATPRHATDGAGPAPVDEPNPEAATNRQLQQRGQVRPAAAGS